MSLLRAKHRLPLWAREEDCVDQQTAFHITFDVSFSVFLSPREFPLPLWPCLDPKQH